MLCLHTITPIGTDDPGGMACKHAWVSGDSGDSGGRTRNASWGLGGRVSVGRGGGGDAPLVEKVAVGVYDVGLAEFCLHEGHDVGQVRFAYILSVRNLAGHRAR